MRINGDVVCRLIWHRSTVSVLRMKVRLSSPPPTAFVCALYPSDSQ
jgi:hypothetical protein